MVKPDFRESLSTIVAMQLLQGESRYMMVPLLVLSLMGTDFTKQRPCTSIDKRNPCEMRRDCCWRTKYTKIEKMLGPVWKKKEWCDDCPADVDFDEDPPPPPSPPPPSPLPLPPPSPPPPLTPTTTTTVHEAWDRHEGQLHCAAPGPDCILVPLDHVEPPRGWESGNETQPLIGGSATRLDGTANAVGWPTPIRNQHQPSDTDFWLAKQGSKPDGDRSRRVFMDNFVPAKAMGEGAAFLKSQLPSVKIAGDPTEAQRAQAKAENEAAARAAGAVLDTLGGGPSYQKQNPEEVWAGQGEKMGKATTQHESTLHLAAAERAPAPRARGDVANTLLWLGDGRGAPPPQMRVG